jgi:hypothetical protein
VQEFLALKAAYVAADCSDMFMWANLDPKYRTRNTVVGTLLVDLSEGMDLDKAVGKFEAKMAPANYKRPTALVTPAMRDKARATVVELGLMSAMDRRYATLEDIAITDVLFADRSARKAMTGDPFDIQTTRSKLSLNTVEEMPIEKFLADVLPRVDSVEVLLDNGHLSNLISLIAPADPTAARLFKWHNNFSWSYVGDFTDSVKERVKRAGGSVIGDLNFRLAWFNYDDLDAHCVEPERYEISYLNKDRLSPSRGVLDVDMNANNGSTRDAVENITYADRRRMKDGLYSFKVHQFCKRESTDVGFEAELEFDGQTLRYEYPGSVSGYVEVAAVQCTGGKFEIVRSLPSSQVAKTAWGLRTQEFHRVLVVALSPNCWGGKQIGNKHYVFALEGCVNDGTARGVYNEFLCQELEPYRKTLEIVGAKLRTEESKRQLSGLGFSSTQRNALTVRVKGSFNRTLKIAF